jgi:excinuclease ABC subunit A
MDEPTTGLSFEDCAALLRVLHRLVDNRNTIVLIEHNLDLIKNADWIIDLGPGAGDKGGHLIATGTPEQLAQTPESHTGRYLRPLLEVNGKKPLAVAEPVAEPAADTVEEPESAKPARKSTRKKTRKRAKEPVAVGDD